MKLTPAIVASLPAGSEVSDDDSAGLRVSVGATGRKTFFRRYRIGGKLKQVKLGTFGAMTLAEARRANEKLRDADPAAEKLAAKEAKAKAEEKPAGPTVGQLIEDYLNLHVDPMRKPKGAAEVRRFLLSPALGGLRAMRADEVKRTYAFDLIVALRAKTPVLAGNIKQELRAAYAFAANRGVLEVPIDPFGFRVHGVTAAKRSRVLSAQELTVLLPWLGNYSEAVRDVLLISLLTGTRSGEVCSIHASEVTDGVWTIPASKAKNGVSFRVMLPRQAAVIIRRRMETRKGWLFPRRDGKGPIDQKVVGVETWTHSPDCPSDRYQPREKCPVSSWAPHDLRRTCRTNLSALGCPVEVAEAVLNHLPVGVRGNYDLHKFDDEKREWLQRWGDYLDTLTPPKLRAVA